LYNEADKAQERLQMMLAVARPLRLKMFCLSVSIPRTVSHITRCVSRQLLEGKFPQLVKNSPSRKSFHTGQLC